MSFWENMKRGDEESRKNEPTEVRLKKGLLVIYTIFLIGICCGIFIGYMLFN